MRIAQKSSIAKLGLAYANSNGDDQMNSTTPSGLTLLLTTQQVTEQTGIPVWKLYELARDGAIPAVRLGKSLRFHPEALSSWIAAGGTGPYSRPCSGSRVSESLEAES